MKKKAKGSARAKQPSRPAIEVVVSGKRIAKRLLDAQRGAWKVGVATLQHAGQAAFPSGSEGLSSAVQGGIKKLEDVFDQRVLSALERAGMPSAAAVRELAVRVERLTEQVRELKKTRGASKPRV